MAEDCVLIKEYDLVMGMKLVRSDQNKDDSFTRVPEMAQFPKNGN